MSLNINTIKLFGQITPLQRTVPPLCFVHATPKFEATRINKKLN